jgi:hypothetical protein
MPERIWAYECCAVRAGATSCPTCGRPGEFAGWGLTVPEAMERYRRAFGFEPIGPHLQLVEQHLASLRSRCVWCGGVGVVGDVYEWRQCPHCEGGGAVWNAPEERIRASYQRIASAHPGAVSGSPPYVLVPDRPPERSRDQRRRPPKGFSIHGLRLADVRAAFVEAERRLGTGWRVKWRGHCRRATLRASYARAVHTVARSWAVVTPRGCGSSRCVYPLPIIHEAARILGVTPWVLIGTEHGGK